MDPAEILHRVDLVPNSPRVDGKMLRQSATLVNPVSKVLGNDDLLIEILLLISYPTTLICAALVCKRWFCQASDTAFLHRFCKLHPTYLLGFYVNTRRNLPCFVPMLAQPTELDVAIRRATSNVDICSNAPKLILDDWNDIIITNKFKKYDEEPESIHIVLNPLCPERGMVIVPPFPCHKHQDGYFYTFSKLLFKEERDNFSYFYVRMESDGTKSNVQVYMLQDGVWCMYTSATIQLPCLPMTLHPLLVDNKIYMASTQSEILVLDLEAISFSTFQLCIWLHTGDNWLLVDTICLCEMYAKLRIPNLTDWVWINRVDLNAGFIFLEMGRWFVYVGIKCRRLCKVYEMTNGDQLLGRIHPCMMIWPPTFPALKDGRVRDAT